MTFLHKLSNRLARLKALLVLSLAVLSCEQPLRITGASSSTVAKIAVTPRNVTLFPDQTTDITAVGFTAAGDTAMGISVSWSVTGGTIVDTSTTSGRHYGRYKSASQLGWYKVAATSSGISDTAAITVARVPVAAVAVSPAAATATVGQAVQLTATPRDSTGAPLSGRTVAWGSSNAGVATVNVSGLVTGVATGAATITATSEGRSGTAAVTVNGVPVASVTVSPASASIMGGQAVQLAATPKDANGNVLTGRVVTWTSSNPGVATVNGTGLVTALAAGMAIITAACESATSTAAITVTNVPVASVTVSPATASVTVGQTVQLTATPRDANGNPLTGRTIAWSTDNAPVALVSTGGVVTAVALGSATITANCEGRTAAGAIAVTAVGAPPALTMDFTQYSSTAALQSAITGGTPPWLVLNNEINQISLVTGLGSAPGVNNNRFMRYTWPGNNSGAQDYTIRAIIQDLPPGGEFWIEVWSRFSAGWRNGPSGGPLYDYKYMIILNSGGSRFNVQMLGQGGSNTQWGYPGNESAWTSSGNGSLGFLSGGPIDMSVYWDGNWHRFRYHLKLSASSSDPTGIATWYIDDRLVHRGTGLQTTPGSGFAEFNFGANMNNAVDQVQTLDWAVLRIYTQNPGWGF